MLHLFTPITTFVFDVDGVLTNGQILVLPQGVMARSMNVKDGYALQLAVKRGYHVVIISGGDMPEAEIRFKKLGIQHVFTKVSNKLACLQNWLAEQGFGLDKCLFMGDDLPDAELLQHVALSACPADACSDVLAIAQYISPKNGGEGCVRDVIEKVLRLNNHWYPETEIRSQ
jgi:3-deoxy-D-manno-octulosonate 8-phosphate phosphatase (KDO 8-P phosphatase)